VSQDNSLSGKTYVVTGANSGIGFEATRAFAARGAEVVLLCRNEERGQKALSRIQLETGNENLHLLLGDFSSLASISRLADELAARFPKIHCLCSNAGGANGSRKVTDEGFELTFATNHLSAFLLLQKLLPGLTAAAEEDQARVVFTSSYGHNNSPIDFNDLNLEDGYSTLKAYGRSKLMNLLTARELHRRYADKGIVASSFHPGAVRTSIWGKGGLVGRSLGLVMYPFMRSEEKGAETMIWLASADDEAARNAQGNYFYDCRRKTTAEFATDAAAQQLWRVSEELIEPYRQHPSD